MGDVSALEVSNFLNTNLFGKNIIINKALSLSSVENNALIFYKGQEIDTDKECLILVPLEFQDNNYPFSYIKVKNPRLSFAKVLQEFFVKKVAYSIDKSVKIGNDCNIDKNVKIGFNSVIGDNVSIGEGTIINNNVVIYDNTSIGKNCYIKSGSIIGEDGFGFDFEDDSTPIRFPHIGDVNIGNNVEIGANTSIARGTIESTLIEDYVKIDDLSIIAHNCLIMEKTIITGHVTISGSVIIGKECWIGPNSTIHQKLNIGNNVTIGMGCTINNNIKNNEIYMESSSMNIKKASIYRVKLNKLIKQSK